MDCLADSEVVQWYHNSFIIIIEVYELKYTIDMMLNHLVWKTTAMHPSPKVMADILDSKINIMRSSNCHNVWYIYGMRVSDFLCKMY